MNVVIVVENSGSLGSGGGGRGRGGVVGGVTGCGCVEGAFGAFTVSVMMLVGGVRRRYEFGGGRGESARSFGGGRVVAFNASKQIRQGIALVITCGFQTRISTCK